MFKRAIVLVLFTILTHSAFGGLARSNVTDMTLGVYGIYLSADPTCQTGLIASVPLSTTPVAKNFAAAVSPTLGSGAIPSSINCVVIVMEDAVALTWAAGSYTSTTNGASDSVCNAGGSLSQKICRSPNTVTFPSQIVTDAAAAGLTLTTSCPASPTGTEAIAIYLSTDAVCSGSNTDPASCNNNNAFAPPSAAGDASAGILLTAPSVSGASFTFVADPDGTTVGNNNGTCQSLGPPLFSFKAN